MVLLDCVAIHAVTVASLPAEFVHNDPLSNLHISKPSDCHTHPELKRQIYSALAEGDEGELSIAIPKEVVVKQSGHTLAGLISEGELPVSRNVARHGRSVLMLSQSCHP